MNDIKIIFCDIDGTLIIKDEKIPQALKKMIERCKKNGIEFTFASGRLPYMIEPLLKDLNILEASYVSCNGALVKKRSKVIYEKKFPIIDLEGIIDIALKNEMTVLYSFDETEYLLNETEATREKRLQRGYYHPLRKMDRKDWKDLEVLKVNILTDSSKESIAIFETEISKLSKQLMFTRYGNTGLEIVSVKVDKLSGVKHILNEKKLDFCQVAAIGDNENDKKLLEHVGIGIAVSNATAEVKQIADYTTQSEAAYGVIEGMQLIMENRRP